MGDTPGSALTMLVLRPNAPTYTVVGVDNETIPTPLPANGLATFNVPQPIAVAAGDVLGVFSTTSGGVCGFFNGAIPAADVVVGVRYPGRRPWARSTPR